VKLQLPISHAKALKKYPKKSEELKKKYDNLSVELNSQQKRIEEMIRVKDQEKSKPSQKVAAKH